ncbi:putative ABC transporter ATP-binding protein [Mannheimia haemolytica]|uniref:Putative ABC transporter ATP-binding protein n=1 Tax=Mannheimia haemolytica TaxID=75985 RepID=A0A378N9V0_MANHA|nr:putative ABC transporter ATP-binding protein [Mannheimia haemolytica]
MLTESDIYEAENKAKLTETLAKQLEAKRLVEEIEMQWLELRRSLRPCYARVLQDSASVHACAI